jgi:dTDP-4-dehydrorhamnose 3,5-epimerase
MKFQPTPIAGNYLITAVPHGDQRGFFGRLFCEREFAAQGLETKFVQISQSFNAQQGTLRGMHYQLGPAAEVKLVRCLRGAIHDVVLDLRPDSPTFGKCFATTLSGDNWAMMYIPTGCAHGFISLTDNSDLLYLMTNFHSPEHERGVRFDDPRFAIEWPQQPVEISVKDKNWPLFDPSFHLGKP